MQYSVIVQVWFDGSSMKTKKSCAVETLECRNVYNVEVATSDMRTFLKNFFKMSRAFEFPGGVPSSLIVGSEQQWDFPNGWSPLNHMIIEGLRKSDSAQMQEEVGFTGIHGEIKCPDLSES